MFSLLDMLNQYLGYFAMATKTKSRIYTVLGALGDLYLLYVGYSFCHNGFWTRGLLILLVAFVLAYFLYLNFIFYFTHKQSKLDITPAIFKLLHINPQVEEENSEKAGQTAGAQAPQFLSNGYFDQRKTMPATLFSTPAERVNIQKIANQMKSLGLINDNYQGKTEAQRKAAVAADPHHRFYAIGAGVGVPYFEMKEEMGNYVVYAGINAAMKVPVGKVAKVGFEDINTINQNRVQLFLANAYLMGGSYLTSGRRGLIEQQEPYSIQLKVAYQQK